MTSTNDGKEVKSNQTSGQKGKSFYVELYKSLDGRLSGECELSDRTQHLCEAWRRVHSLCQHSAPTTHPHLVAWLQRHTARTILQTEWQSPKSKDEHKHLEEAINDFIEECDFATEGRNGISPPWESQLRLRGEWFKKILANPWGHPVLRVLLDPRGQRPSDDEILEWLKEERGVMFVTRLRQLAASKCDDLAMSLVTCVMDRVRDTCELLPDSGAHREQPAITEGTFALVLRAEAGFTVEVWELVTDIEFVLLHKADKMSKCIELAKQTPLRDGYQLVERLQSRLENSPREKKLWKNAKEVATLIAQVIIARCMVVPICAGVARTALYCCARSLARLIPKVRLPAAAATLAAPAATARHLHTLAAAYDAQCSSDMKPFVCELYVRAITAGMNELERLKLKTERESEARSAEQTLCSWFTQLGSLLSASDRIMCECTLTAFSVHPSPAMYDRIKNAPILPPVTVDDQDVKQETTSEFGSWATDSRTYSNLVKTSETLNIKQTQPKANVLSTAILTEGEGLGLSPELCMDLAVLLSGPRLKTLSCDMDRELLLDNCRTYLERTHGGTRALTTELKYLNLDPRSYQHLPEEEDDENDVFYGIEKGYEHLVELQEQDRLSPNAIFDFEETQSAYSDIDIDSPTPVRRKKKIKKPKITSDEESDPLSIVAEAKKSEKKKERPLSKERSKDDSSNKEKKERKKKKKATGDSAENKERSRERRKDDSVSKEKKEGKEKKAKKKKEGKEKKEMEKKEGKEKKPRKKKPKEPKVEHLCEHKPGSLSSLIGMKVAKITSPDGKHIRNPEAKATGSVTDSDYDSQGKSSLASLNSEGNGPDVLFDGLFTDEYRSPEKSDPLSERRASFPNSEVSFARGQVAINYQKSNKLNTQSLLKQSHYKMKPEQTVSDASSPSSPQSITTTDVKKKISGLLEFRRQKNMLERAHMLEQAQRLAALHNFKSPPPTPPLLNPMTPPNLNPLTPPNLKPSTPIKSPNAIIQPIYPDQQIISPKAVDVPEIPKVYINKKQIDQIKVIRDEVDVYLKSKFSSKPVIQYASKQTTDESPQSTTQNECLNLSTQKHDSCPTAISPQQTQHSVTVQSINRSNLSFHESYEKSLQDFLRELHETSNAGTGKCATNTAKSTNRNVRVKKEVKPVSRVTPITPNVSSKVEPTSSQCAKINNQGKQLETQLNTFARLSYMHKNKQLAEAVLNHQEYMLNRSIEEQRLAQFMCLQKSKVVTSKTGNSTQKTSKVDDKNIVIRKVEKPTVSQEHPRKVEKPTVLQERPLKIEKTIVSQEQLRTVEKPTVLQEHLRKVEKPTVLQEHLRNVEKSTVLQENRKFEKPTVSEEHPLLSNLLYEKPCESSESIVKNISLQPEKRRTGSSSLHSKESSLSQKDQNDLLSLLRQQNMLNTHPAPYANTVFSKNNKIVNDPQCSKTTTPNSSNCNPTVNIAETVIKNHPIEISNHKYNINRNYDVLNIKRVLEATQNVTFRKVIDCKTAEISKTMTYKKGDAESSSLNPFHNQVETTHNENQFNSNSTKVDANGKDWQEVMNALLSHKTPSRGPNALDMVLKKGSDKKLRNQRIVRPNVINETSKEPKLCNETNIKQVNTVPHAPNAHSHPIVKSSIPSTVPLNSTNMNLGRLQHPPKLIDSIPKKTSDMVQSEIDKLMKRCNQPETTKKLIKESRPRNSSPTVPSCKQTSKNVKKQTVPQDIARPSCMQEEIKSKDIPIRQDIIKKLPNAEKPKRGPTLKKPCTTEFAQEKDPFISGISNSDYDLLEELMDDELRKEIGELSSDEDTYRVQTSNVKSTKTPSTSICSNVTRNAPPQQEKTTHINVPQSCRKSIIQTNQIHAPCQNKPKVISDIKIVNNNLAPNQFAGKIIKQYSKDCQTSSDFTASNQIACPTVVHQPLNTNVVSIRSIEQPSLLTSSNHVSVVDPRNVIITMPQRTLQNVVVIGSELVYDPYAATQTMGLTNVNQSSYVRFESPPNLTVFQTTQFAAPLVNPCIIGNAMTVQATSVSMLEVPLDKSTTQENRNCSFLKSNEVPESRSEMAKYDKTNPNIQSETLIQTNNVSHNFNNQGLKNSQECELGTKPKDEVLKPFNMNSSVAKKDKDVTDAVTHDEKAEILMKPTEIKSMIMNSSNKNCERKVLKEVQEKQKLNDEIQPCIQKQITSDDNKKTDKELELTVHLPKTLKEPKHSVENVVTKESTKEKERLKNKRLALLNREINHRSDDPPIPLNYTPLKLNSSPSVKKVVTTAPSKEKRRRSRVESDNIKINNNMNTNNEKHVYDNSKENDSIPTPRRILLRSSNVIQAKDSDSQTTQIIKKKAKMEVKDKKRPSGKVSLLKPQVEAKGKQSDIDQCKSSNNSKKLPKLILKVPAAAPDKESIKPPKKVDKLILKIPKPKNKKTKTTVLATKKSLKKKSPKPQLIKSSNETNCPSTTPAIDTNLNFIDVEEALVGAKIPRKPMLLEDVKKTKCKVASENRDKIFIQHLDIKSSEPLNNNNSKSRIRNESQKETLDKSEEKIPNLKEKRICDRTVEPLASKPNILMQDNSIKSVSNNKHNSDSNIRNESLKEVTLDKNEEKISNLKEKTKCDRTVEPQASMPNIIMQDSHTKSVSNNKSLDNNLDSNIRNESLKEVTLDENKEKIPNLKEKKTCDKTVEPLASKPNKLMQDDHSKSVSNNNLDSSPKTLVIEKHSKSDKSGPTASLKLNLQKTEKDNIVIQKPDLTKSTFIGGENPCTVIHQQEKKSERCVPTSVIKTSISKISLNENSDTSQNKQYSRSPAVGNNVPNCTKMKLSTSSAPHKNVPRKENISQNTNVLDNLKRDDTLNYLKNNVSIEEMPEDIQGGNSEKKCVRIKLPNGKTFKATVYGKMHFSYESLFSNPTLKNALLSNLHPSRRRYTLNVKQVSTQLAQDPSKIVDARIEEIKLQPSGDVIETVNLLSDDDEENDDVSIQDTKIEFGGFKVSDSNKHVFEQHRDKLTKKCLVKLVRTETKKEEAVKHCETIPIVNLSNEEKIIPLNEKVLIDINSVLVEKVTKITETKKAEVVKHCENIPIVYVSNEEKNITPLNEKVLVDINSVLAENFTKFEAEKVTKIEADKVIEIDDSSNDSLSLVADLLILPNNPTKEPNNFHISPSENYVKPEAKINELKNLLLKDLGVGESENQEIMHHLANDILHGVLSDNKNCKDAPIIKECTVTLTRCDSLVEQYERAMIIKQKCLVNVVRCDDTIIGENNVNSHDEELLASDEFIDAGFDEDNQNKTCLLSRSNSLSLLNDFMFYNQDDTVKEESPYDSYECDRSSPVIDVFETIVTFRKFSKVEKKMQDIFMSEINPLFCSSEWSKTKRETSLESKLAKLTLIKSDNVCLDTCIISHSHETLKTEIPSLKALTAKLFKNYSILDSYTISGLRKTSYDNTTKDVLQSSTHTLKRKLKSSEARSSGSKILKMDNSFILDVHEKSSNHKNDWNNRKLNTASTNRNDGDKNEDSVVNLPVLECDKDIFVCTLTENDIQNVDLLMKNKKINEIPSYSFVNDTRQLHSLPNDQLRSELTEVVGKTCNEFEYSERKIVFKSIAPIITAEREPVIRLSDESSLNQTEIAQVIADTSDELAMFDKAESLDDIISSVSNESVPSESSKLKLKKSEHQDSRQNKDNEYIYIEDPVNKVEDLRTFNSLTDCVTHSSDSEIIRQDVFVKSESFDNIISSVSNEGETSEPPKRKFKKSEEDSRENKDIEYICTKYPLNNIEDISILHSLTDCITYFSDNEIIRHDDFVKADSFDNIISSVPNEGEPSDPPTPSLENSEQEDSRQNRNNENVYTKDTAIEHQLPMQIKHNIDEISTINSLSDCVTHFSDSEIIRQDVFVKAESLDNIICTVPNEGEPSDLPTPSLEKSEQEDSRQNKNNENVYTKDSVIEHQLPIQNKHNIEDISTLNSPTDCVTHSSDSEIIRHEVFVKAESFDNIISSVPNEGEPSDPPTPSLERYEQEDSRQNKKNENVYTKDSVIEHQLPIQIKHNIEDISTINSLTDCVTHFSNSESIRQDIFVQAESFDNIISSGPNDGEPSEPPTQSLEKSEQEDSRQNKDNVYIIDSVNEDKLPVQNPYNIEGISTLNSLTDCVKHSFDSKIIKQDKFDKTDSFDNCVSSMLNEDEQRKHNYQKSEEADSPQNRDNDNAYTKHQVNEKQIQSKHNIEDLSALNSLADCVTQSSDSEIIRQSVFDKAESFDNNISSVTNEDEPLEPPKHDYEKSEQEDSHQNKNNVNICTKDSGIQLPIQTKHNIEDFKTLNSVTESTHSDNEIIRQDVSDKAESLGNSVSSVPMPNEGEPSKPPHSFEKSDQEDSRQNKDNENFYTIDSVNEDQLPIQNKHNIEDFSTLDSDTEITHSNSRIVRQNTDIGLKMHYDLPKSIPLLSLFSNTGNEKNHTQNNAVFFASNDPMSNKEPDIEINNEFGKNSKETIENCSSTKLPNLDSFQTLLAAVECDLNNIQNLQSNNSLDKSNKKSEHNITSKDDHCDDKPSELEMVNREIDEIAELQADCDSVEQMMVVENKCSDTLCDIETNKNESYHVSCTTKNADTEKKYIDCDNNDTDLDNTEVSSEHTMDIQKSCKDICGDITNETDAGVTLACKDLDVANKLTVESRKDRKDCFEKDAVDCDVNSSELDINRIENSVVNEIQSEFDLIGQQLVVTDDKCTIFNLKNADDDDVSLGKEFILVNNDVNNSENVVKVNQSELDEVVELHTESHSEDQSLLVAVNDENDKQGDDSDSANESTKSSPSVELLDHGYASPNTPVKINLSNAVEKLQSNLSVEVISEELIDYETSIEDTYIDTLKEKFGNPARKEVTLVCKDRDDLVLTGIEYEDPVEGTYYVFPIIEENDETQEVIEVTHEIDDSELTGTNLDERSEEDILEVKIPKVTYSRLKTRTALKNIKLKRKLDMTDVMHVGKRYRKENQFRSRITPSNLVFGKEYKGVMDYCNSLKFSFSHPFHKDAIDVQALLKNWPIKGACAYSDSLCDNDESITLFRDKDSIQSNPADVPFAEEINENYNDLEPQSDTVDESNFKMGFGEGSDRVIQNLEEVGDVSKFSAATLSDVKQTQPFLLSEEYDCKQELDSHEKHFDDQLEKLKQYITYIQLRDKVRSFFQKTSVELGMGFSTLEKVHNFNYKSSTKHKINCPFDLCLPDFIEPSPIEAVVQVVQVGQLPVSAAAQNPVTCDPRVTQVSDASPSQCSVENSPQDDAQVSIKTEYTELTTADLTLPLVQEYAQHNQNFPVESQSASNIQMSNENIPIETEVKSIVKIELEELPEVKEENRENFENNEFQPSENKNDNNVDFSFESSNPANSGNLEPQSDFQNIFNATEKQNDNEAYTQKQQNGTSEKTDQIAHAMNAAGITTSQETITSATRAHALVNILSQKLRQGAIGAAQSATNTYPKTTSINAMALQQALAQILPPPLNQTNVSDSNQQSSNTQVAPQVLHIVQGKNATGSQITLVDNSQQSVINSANATPVLHIVQNKSGTTSTSANGTATSQANAFSGLSLVDAGLQQGGNQLLHIVNTGSQKNNNATGQLLKRVNLLTNLANVQGSNEQKMVQFVCKSADGKSIQLNAPHQRSMVLRLQPIETPNVTVQATPPKSSENQDGSTNSNTNSLAGKDNSSQQEIKSRSVYEENYAKFIQNSSSKSTISEKSTSLPKFNQAFGKPVFQDGNQKTEINSNNSHLSSVNNNNDTNECQSNDNAMNLDHIGQISSPPLLLRKSPQTSQSQANLVQQLKQTIAPMNIQTMHGGVIYTRQIPVNIGGGQTINLITVPSTELIDDSAQKQQSGNQTEIEQSIIKIVPQSQNTSNSDMSVEESNVPNSGTNENTQNSQPQPVLTQMRIKLPMLSKAPQMVSGARVVRPSFFQIQRNVIGGANQPVYQQLVLTAAPPLGQQTIRLPQAQTSRPIKVPTESQSSAESQMSSSTLEQLREFDMVLEQVKERSTVQPGSSTSTTFPKLHTPSTDTTDSGTSASSTSTESTQQVLYSIGNSQPLNVAYVNRKATVTTPTTTGFARSPDSSGIVDSPTSTHVQIPHTVTSENTQNENSTQQKAAKVSSKSKSRPKASSNPPNNLKLNTVPPKTSAQKPLEDEQTTQRILYILAEYKEQVENSPDKDKPAPRRRSNPPSNPGSSKRKKSSSGSRRHGARDLSPVHGEDTCRTMGSEDSSCGTSQGDCNESCLESHSPQDSPRKVVRKLTFEPETPSPQPRPQPQRNVIVADGQTITVARGTAGKPATAVLMPANYILPVSMVKGGQQIAIVTNRGPKLLTVGGGEGGATNALLLQRLIGPAGLKPVLARPGVRHVRLPTAALHNLQAFNLATTTTIQPPDSTASPAPAPTPPELVDTRANSSPWTDRDMQDVKPEHASSPEGSEPWNLPSSGDPHDYSYEETVRAENLDRTVLDPIPDRYSPDMEAQRIFDKMFDVESKKSYMGDSHDDSPRCGYDIDASDCDDKAYHQVVQKKDGSSHRQHRLTHVSAAALRHKYAILEHELRLQKSLSEECEDLGVDSPSASELFPEAELLFAASPAHDHTQDHAHHSHTPQPTHLNQSGIPQPDMDDQIATDQLLSRNDINDDQRDLNLGLEDVGIVTVSEDGMQATIALDQEEFARSHPNTTFHSEPTDDGEVQPFTIAGLKARHITSTIFHSNRAPATVLMTTPQTTVISQATTDNNVKYGIDNMMNSLPTGNNSNINLASVLVKDDGLTRFDNILNDSRELHLSNTASAIVHPTGNAAQVIRRVCYDEDKRDNRFLMDEPDALIAGDDAKMIAEDSSRDATLESMADVDDDRSSPERHAELFWESNSASASESRRPLDFSSDSEKCCKSPSYDTNSTDSSGVGTHMRLDSVIKEARGIERSGSAEGSSADDTHPPLRTYPPKRTYHPLEGEVERSLSGKTRAGERSPDSLEVRRRASGRGVVKRGCHCCNGSPAPPRPKKPRQRKPTMDFTTN